MSGERPWRKIKSLGKVVTGKTPSTRDPENFGGLYPFITIPDLNGQVYIRNTERTISKQGAELLRACLLPADAVMISCIATVGRCGITAKPSFTNQQINSVICSDNVEPRYLYYCFTQLKFQLEATGGGGSVYTNVSKSRFSELGIPLPPLPEQRAIAAILGALDDKIELNRQMNDTLDAMAQALFRNWFVDFEPFRDQGIEDSTLGPIPRAWNVVRIADLGEVVCGKTPPTADPENYGGSIPFITIPDMHDKVFVISTGSCLTQRGQASQPKKLLPKHAVCVSCIATPGLVALTSEPSHTNQQINSIICSDDISPFWCYLAMTRLREDIVIGGAGGSATLNLNKNEFSKLHLAKPNQVTMWRFHQIVQPLFSRILCNEKENAVLADTRDALLPKLLSGEIRVKDVEKFVKRAV